MTEHEESKYLAVYLEGLKLNKKIIVYSKIPSETYTTSWKQKGKNKSEGVHRGVPDYIIVTPNTVIFCELKTEKGGVVSPDQKIWIESLEGKTVKAFVAKGHKEAIHTIESMF